VNFDLTQDQLAIRDMVRDLARNEIAPHAAGWDERQEFPHELFAKLGELGLLGVLIPEDYGGAGLGYVEYVLILEEIGAADGGVGLGVAALAVHQPPLPVRLGRAPTRVPAQAGER
jgi:short/branched chain acyl-CoA dehydrogenase